MRVSHMRTASRGKAYGLWLRPQARGHVGRGSNTSETLVNVAGSQDQMDDGSNGRQSRLNSFELLIDNFQDGVPMAGTSFLLPSL